MLEDEPDIMVAGEASDGEEALDYLFCRGEYSGRSPADAPELVLLDLKLPKVDGLQVIRQVKGSEECGFIPIVVLTSNRTRDVHDALKRRSL